MPDLKFILIASLLCCLQYNLQAQLPSLNQQSVTNPFGQFEISDYFKKGFHLNRFTTEASFIYNRGLYSNDLLTSDKFFQLRMAMNAGLELAGIPVKASYIRTEAYPSLLYSDQQNWYKVEMDVEAYREKWKNIARKLGPEAITKSGQQLKVFKDQLQQQLLAATKNTVRSVAQAQFDSLNAGFDLLSMKGKTRDEIVSQLYGQDLGQLTAKAKQDLQNILAKELDQGKKDSLVSLYQERIESLEEKAAYAEKLYSLIQQAEKSGAFKTMEDLELKSQKEFQELMNNPDALIRKLGEKFKLGGITKFISLLSKFKLGGQAFSNAGSQIPFLAKGISIELNLGNRFLGFGTGSIVPVSNDLFYNTSISNQIREQKKPDYWYLEYRQGRISESYKGFKLTSITSQDNSDMQMQPVSLSDKTRLIIDLFSRENLFGNTWLYAEASKSLATGTMPKENLFNLNNTSFRISIEGRSDNSGLHHHLYFNKSAGAFSNFSRSFLSSDGYETGFSIRKRKLKSPLSFNLKGSFKNFSTPGTSDGKWKILNLRARSSYKFKKRQSVTFHANWQEGYKRYDISAVTRIVRQRTKGLATDFSLTNKRIFGLYNTSFVSAGVQQDVFPILGIPGKTEIKSTAYNLLLNQVFLKGDHLLQFNVIYTKVTQSIEDYLYNTRLDLDGGGVFRISDKLSIGASLVFGYFRAAYTNIGLRPYVSGTVFKKFTVDFSGDFRKNLILVNPLFEQFLNLNCGIKYNLK